LVGFHGKPYPVGWTRHVSSFFERFLSQEQNTKYFSKETYLHRFPAKFNTNEGSNPVCFGALGKILSNDVCLFYFASVSVIFLGSLQSAIAFKLGTNPNPHRVYQIQFKVED